MGLSIFTTTTDAARRGDTFRESLKCYEDLADEVVIVNGGWGVHSWEDNKRKTVRSYWPREFSWEFIGQQFEKGYQACTQDWCIRMDLDFLFHEKDFEAIKQMLSAHPLAPALSFYKKQFILPDRFNVKSRLVLALNKKEYGDRLKLNGGGDLCQPTLDGRELMIDGLPETGIAIYNYEKLVKTKKQIADDQGRMERAWFKRFGEYQMSKDGTDESAYKAWYQMQQGRFNKPNEKIKLSEHPKYIQETIKNLKPENFGYNGFGLIEGRVYA